jgi:hypothetical protein
MLFFHNWFIEPILVVCYNRQSFSDVYPLWKCLNTLGAFTSDREVDW